MALPAQDELAPAWMEISRRLRQVVGDSIFEIWLAPLTVEGWDGRRLILGAPPDTRSWIATRFGRILEGAVAAVIGSAVEVVFAGAAGGAERRGRSGTPALAAGDGAALEITPSLNPRYSFEQFIIGRGNHLAHGAALAVAEHPGQAYNPLFLYAPPGLGKTHLLHAIGNYVQSFGAGSRVLYTTVEGFTNHFLTALGSRSVEQFKRAYRSVDVLLIDDVQFLASKVKTEEEFFHTFNALYENGRQIVLTADRLPRQLVAVEDRLRERFESGLVAQIEPPDLDTRLAILRKRGTLDGIMLADDVLELIASRVTDNVRALEGALIRIVAHHSLTRQPIDAALALKVLDQIHPVAPASGAATIARIQRVVADHFGLEPDALRSASRAARVAWARQLAIHLSRELTDSSLAAIGEAFGGRNHATVLHACKRVSERITSDPEAAQDLETLSARLASDDVDRPS